MEDMIGAHQRQNKDSLFNWEHLINGNFSQNYLDKSGEANNLLT